MKRCVLAILLVGSPAAADAGHAALHCSVDVGRNVQVTHTERLERLYILEASIAVDPRNPRNMIVGGFTPASTRGGIPDNWSFYSRDGGRSWQQSRFHLADGTQADHVGWPHFDSIFGPDGSALFNNSVRIFRSRDGGRVWHQLVGDFGLTDRAAVGADRSAGPHGGNIYMGSWGRLPIAARAGSADPASEFGIHFMTFRGNDLSHSVWAATSERLRPQLQYDGSIILGAFGEEIFVDREGGVFMPFLSSQAGGPQRTTRYWITKSDDGGRSFGPAYELLQASGEPLLNPVRAIPFASLAMDRSVPEPAFVIAWAEMSARTGSYQVYFSRSDDGGHTWAPKRAVTGDLGNPQDVMNSGSYAGGVVPTMPNIQVNNRGMVLISWQSLWPGEPTPNGRPTISHRRVAVASVDGGRHFLPVMQIASAETHDYRPANSVEDRQQRVDANGDLGHYLRTAVDDDGRFHMIWLDGRTGRQEIWYAPVTISCA